ncbi:MAG: ribbon-helix-helix protein, CopG family, partial [Vulcanimicrobiota bacterium]
PLLANPARRMNITLSPRLSDLLARLKKETTLNQSEIIRRALVATESDPAVLEELKSLLDLYD